MLDFSSLKIKEIDCVIRFTAEEMRFTVQNRNNHIIGIQLSGSAMHYFDDKKFIIDENSVYFLNQKDNYKVKIFEKGLAFSIHFTTYEPIDTESFCKKIPNVKELLKMLNIIEKGFLSKDDELSLLSNIYNFCSKLNKIYQKSYFPKDKRMTDAEKYIKTHFSEKDCLSEAARISTLSRRRFNELFKSCFRLTPNKYITALKIDYAKSLMNTNYLSTSQISEMCGFSDICYFCKVFKSETGTTPGEYKRNICIAESE